jgi:glycine betaine catabolism B
MTVPPWKKGRIVRVEDRGPDTKSFWIEDLESLVFNFEPGQFVTLDLPIGEKPSKRWRSYSIASWPDGTNVFELVIIHKNDGHGTEYLFKQTAPGTEIIFRGPQGKFLLPPVVDKDLFLICTGTGIAPFRSMLHHLIRNNVPHKNIYLIFGTRTEKDLLYREEFNDLSNSLAHFHYMPVLSREEWLGEKGYVHQVYEKMVEDKRPAYFYLCGWKKMIEDAKHKLIELGYDRKDIHYEIYG